MARPKRLLVMRAPLQKWYVYNWLMRDYDTYSSHTIGGMLFVKNKPISYNAGAAPLGRDGNWLGGYARHGSPAMFKAYSWSEVVAFAAGRCVELVDCRRPLP